MRISSGKLKGLEILSQDSLKTRPTGIKVRQAVFNSLQSFIPDSQFLDLFSGSGAIGIEASSRGVFSSTLVELDSKAFRFLTKNVQKALDRNQDLKLYPIKEEVGSFLKKTSSQSKSYDLIWADPPYADCPKFIRVFDSYIPLILKDQFSYFILESSSKDSSLVEKGFSNLDFVKSKTYGICSISFFKLKIKKGEMGE